MLRVAYSRSFWNRKLRFDTRDSSAFAGLPHPNNICLINGSRVSQNFHRKNKSIDKRA